jgi:hypothetical protein
VNPGAPPIVAPSETLYNLRRYATRSRRHAARVATAIRTTSTTLPRRHGGGAEAAWAAVRRRCGGRRAWKRAQLRHRRRCSTSGDATRESSVQIAAVSHRGGRHMPAADLRTCGSPAGHSRARAARPGRLRRGAAGRPGRPATPRNGSAASRKPASRGRPRTGRPAGQNRLADSYRISGLSSARCAAVNVLRVTPAVVKVHCDFLYTPLN